MMICLLKICSMVLQPGLIPPCSVASSSSALAWSRLKITESILQVTEPIPEGNTCSLYACV